MKTTLKFIQLISIASFLLVIFSSCKKDSLKDCYEHSISACSENPLKTNLRIKNNTKYNFCNVVVNPYSGLVNCGNLKKGKVTSYRAFDIVYNYAFIQFFIGEKEFKVQPYDYIGEQALGTGKFTFILDIINFETGQVSITVQED